MELKVKFETPSAFIFNKKRLRQLPKPFSISNIRDVQKKLPARTAAVTAATAAAAISAAAAAAAISATTAAAAAVTAATAAAAAVFTRFGFVDLSIHDRQILCR